VTWDHVWALDDPLSERQKAWRIERLVAVPWDKDLPCEHSSPVAASFLQYSLGEKIQCHAATATATAVELVLVLAVGEEVSPGYPSYFVHTHHCLVHSWFVDSLEAETQTPSRFFRQPMLHHDDFRQVERAWKCLRVVPNVDE
jgi:hypothetical protein